MARRTQDVVSPWTCEFVFEMTGGADGLVLLLQREQPAPLSAARLWP
jgi:hypothetical protein